MSSSSSTPLDILCNVAAAERPAAADAPAPLMPPLPPRTLPPIRAPPLPRLSSSAPPRAYHALSAPALPVPNALRHAALPPPCCEPLPAPPPFPRSFPTTLPSRSLLLPQHAQLPPLSPSSPPMPSHASLPRNLSAPSLRPQQLSGAMGCSPHAPFGAARASASEVVQPSSYPSSSLSALARPPCAPRAPCMPRMALPTMSVSTPSYGSPPTGCVGRPRGAFGSPGSMKGVSGRATKSSGRRDSYTRFTAEEEAMLLDGVRVFGVGNWKKILNSYRFHWKRTAVDLKDKYRNMTRAKMRRINAAAGAQTGGGRTAVGGGGGGRTVVVDDGRVSYARLHAALVPKRAAPDVVRMQMSAVSTRNATPRGGGGVVDGHKRVGS